jgi:peptide/nickel transport system permease protein
VPAQISPITLRPPWRRRAWLATRRAFSSWKVSVGLIGLGIMVLLAILGPHVAPYDPSATSSDALQAPSWSHPFGTTLSGQDVFSQFLVGAGPSLLVGFVAAAFATILSLIFGLLSAYLRGVVAESLSFISNVFLVIPTLPLLIVVGAYLPNTGYTVLALVIGLTSWAWGARVIRAQVLSLKSRDYILAARATGERTWRVLLFELMPGLIPVIAASFLFMVTYAILTEAGLAFLGLGDLTKWTWGTMLYWTQNDDAFLQGAWWWYVPPGLAIALVGLFLAFINFGIDEFANARLREVQLVKRSALRRLFHRGGRPSPAPAPQAVSSPLGQPGHPNPVITVDRLRVEIGLGNPICAVDDVSFTIGKGEIFGIAGESGCGKSTLLNTLARILPSSAHVTSGAVLYQRQGEQPVDVLQLEGEELRKLRWARIAIVTQAAMNALNPVMNVERQLLDVLEAHEFGANRRQRQARSNELLAMVGIPLDRLRAFPHELSGGMRQRVMIAMALALEPDVLLLDEPTTALDVVTQRQIIDEVLQIRDRMGISIVFVTHDLSLLLETADRIAIMYAGQVVEVASSAALRQAPAHPYTRALLVSLPTMHGRPGDREQLKGAPPNMRDLPHGCRFQSRCKFADAICVERAPLLQPVNAGPGEEQKAACHLFDDDAVMVRPMGTAVQFTTAGAP